MIPFQATNDPDSAALSGPVLYTRPPAFGLQATRPAAVDFGIGTWRDLTTGAEWWSDGFTWSQPMEPFNADSYDLMSAGEELLPRDLGGTSISAGSSGDVRLTFFAARHSEPITQLRLRSGTTPAGATPTLVRWGVYIENPDLSLDLLASINSDTGLLAAASAVFTRSLTSTWNKIRGQRYAIGQIIVTAAAMPNITGGTNPDNALMAMNPKLSAIVAGQADLPAHIAAASLAGGPSRFGWVMLP